MPLFSLGGCCANAVPVNVKLRINAHLIDALVITLPLAIKHALSASMFYHDR
jgi:hypothetical protein